MNYLAHGIHCLSSPYRLAGTAVPDWLSVVARPVRIRRVLAERYLADPRPDVAEMAQGIVDHHQDDQLFHGSAAFQQLCWELTADVRDQVDGERGMRPAFVGHILVEILLDAHLSLQRPDVIDAYYRALGRVQRDRFQQALDRIAPAPVPTAGRFLERFLEEKFLYDYADDGKLLMRLNQVMRRVSLPLLPARVGDILPAARRRVHTRLAELVHFHPPLAACFRADLQSRGGPGNGQSGPPDTQEPHS